MITDKTLQLGKWHRFLSSDLRIYFQEKFDEECMSKIKHSKENSIFLLLDWGKSNPSVESYSNFYIKILYEGKLCYLHYATGSLFDEKSGNYILCLK